MKKVKFFKKERSQFNLHFYWRLAVCFTFVAVCLSFVFGYYFFKKINEEFVFEADDSTSRAHTIRKERIDKVLEYFSARENKSNEIRNSPSPVIDPSL